MHKAWVQMKYKKICYKLIKQIEVGKIAYGQMLPSIRKLQSYHCVSKNTVLRALQELEIQGFIEAKQRRGFFVCWQFDTKVDNNAVQSTLPTALDLPQVFHDIMETGAAFDWFPSASEKFHSKHLSSLHRSIFNAARKNEATSSGYYEPPQGSPDLRKQIVKSYQRRNCFLNSDDILITSGCQNSLYLALRALTKAGDTVAIESPSFYGVLQLLETLELKVLEIATNANNGICLAQLEEYSKHQTIRACIVTPSFSTPTGSCIPDLNKLKLIELAEANDFYLIEDDIYGELGLMSNPPPLASFDKSGRVILCGSWSKSLSRDLRLGWVASSKFVSKMLRFKLNMQLALPQSTQEGLAEFIAKGHYRRHLKVMINHLIEQRATLISELKQFWPKNIEYNLPQGGLTLWVRLPESIDTVHLYQKLLDEQIILTPGLLFSSDNMFSNFLRLSFLQPINNERKQALRHIGKVLKSIDSVKLSKACGVRFI